MDRNDYTMSNIGEFLQERKFRALDWLQSDGANRNLQKDNLVFGVLITAAAFDGPINEKETGAVRRAIHELGIQPSIDPEEMHSILAELESPYDIVVLAAHHLGDDEKAQLYLQILAILMEDGPINEDELGLHLAAKVAFDLDPSICRSIEEKIEARYQKPPPGHSKSETVMRVLLIAAAADQPLQEYELHIVERLRRQIDYLDQEKPLQAYIQELRESGMSLSIEENISLASRFLSQSEKETIFVNVMDIIMHPGKMSEKENFFAGVLGRAFEIPVELYDKTWDVLSIKNR